MEFSQAIILALIQGVTEFLPVSSSAHLIIIPTLMGWADQGVVFDIAVHIGTLGAVMLYFRHDVARLFKACGDILEGHFKTENVRLFTTITIATLPIIGAGLLFASFIETFARAIPVLAFTSIAFGLLLYKADKHPVTKSVHILPNLKEAAIFGIFQAIAIIPGVSRSGICVTAGRLMGFSRNTSGAFASLMAMPTILIAGLYSLTKINQNNTLNWASDANILLVATFTAFLCGLAGIHLLMTWLARVGYWPFVVYRIALGFGLLLFMLF